MLGNFRATFGYIVKQLFLNLLAQSIHALSLNNTFFSMLVKIFSNKSYFCFSANIFFGLQCIAGLAFEVDWFESLTSLGDHFENFASGGVLSKRMPRRNIVRERNERGFHLSCLLSRASSLSLVMRFSGPKI